MKKQLSLLLIFALVIAIVPTIAYGSSINMPKSFSDIGNHWSNVTISKLIEMGAIGGYPDGSFKPNNTIKRSEVAAILRKALKLELINDNSFADTASHWAGKEIHTLVANNIIDKNEYGTSYSPETNTTRVELAKMIVRAMGLEKNAKDLSGKATNYLDDKDIINVDKGYVILANQQGIISGYPDNTFKPNQTVTRAEASSMIVRMIEKMTGQILPVPELPKTDNYTNAEDLPKLSFRELGYNFEDKIKTHGVSSVGEVIKADPSLFPLKFGNFVITGIEKLPYSKTPYYKSNEIGWQGSTSDAIVVHGYPVVKTNDRNGIVQGFSLPSIQMGILNKGGDFSKRLVVIFLEERTVTEKMKTMYPNTKIGDAPRAKENEHFTILFTDREGYGLNNIKSIFLLDQQISTDDLLEIDFSKIP
ncbi:hypothetical protein HNQ80_005057 [Anaerosolibacter carboniphilus]|uniref:SLH domain-containing protein n=1 Tax=Anaerosolibacter carboniphilus TaxID=1417629 RepID=A0A841L731_9FIRM|nr:S-layer homology domain-containing protein [Anaerosolibacter carboniphilus]MBB6218882.1 hypothetical protein [Anaerosolibacter carboniphilus]